ncbi:SF0329 family protein [Paenibacillus sp. LPE1-1-1.1]|uniref:SF0329 family protein n=1 Tax=Paenibacillus sp. LPE1-1-1.1 TaxID=3135230 RepID=UPI003414120A
MQWNKLKKQLDSRVSHSLKRRVVFHSTSYRGTHDQVGKAWITFDNEMIQDFCTINRENKRITLATGIHNQYEFYYAVEEYLGLSINEALASTNPIIRALSILDRRLGKRRLISIRDDHPIVNKLLIIRILVEYLEP